MKKPKIIVIGAGYAGMAFLKSLDEECFKKGDFTIINKNSYHYHSTMLHKVATAEKSGKIMFDLREILHPEIKIIQQLVTDIDEKNHVITTEFGSYEYDYLVCAAGFEKESFNLEGISNAMFIDSYSQSARICEQIKLKFDQALENEKGMEVVVCGGGLTGIEFAASCANMIKEKCKFYNVSKQLQDKFKVKLVSSTPRLLTFFSEKLSKKTADKLEELGVNVIHDTKIKSLEKNKVIFEDGSFNADLIVWTAGVKGASIVSDSDRENERGRVKVDDKLRAIGSKHMFYIGDVSAVKDKKNGGYYPPTAQIACEQGAYLAREFRSILFNEEFNEEFNFRSNGIICSIGHKYSVAKVFGFELSGLLPSFLKTIVEKKWNVKILGIKGIFL
ncbi:NADH:quinone oxidoreductase II [Campylobacter pinnipediorum subsp. caledonicus]|uniref:NADH:ubiquinone reductase (non-electrogenic) n=1 Tax=Campylobacter pinnipediorum subsp. caledonicus TaxID=1874362 RepID=A0A1S6U7I9_9BACT|nr:FAD-dependent oxidoreductase [Campylobacter pinnipediorum]AQW87708.1 NADH:quinone oxidoreductase II [Campylobacter pinnipediorum subsp. caledonicus]